MIYDMVRALNTSISFFMWACNCFSLLMIILIYIHHFHHSSYLLINISKHHIHQGGNPYLSFSFLLLIMPRIFRREWKWPKLTLIKPESCPAQGSSMPSTGQIYINPSLYYSAPPHRKFLCVLRMPERGRTGNNLGYEVISVMAIFRAGR